MNGTTRVLKAATGHINANGISYCYWVSDAMIDKLGAIEQFIAGYFHQDWDLDGADDGEVIASFVEGESMEHVQEVVSCLEEKLNGPSFNAKAANIFCNKSGAHQVRCAYRYQADGYSGAEWLNSVVFGFAA